MIEHPVVKPEVVEEKMLNYLVQSMNSDRESLAMQINEEMKKYPKGSAEYRALKAHRFAVLYGAGEL